MTHDSQTTTEQTVIDEEAQRLWETFDKTERGLVSFGLFPAKKMEASDLNVGEGVRKLAVALMKLANENKCGKVAL